MEKSSSARTPWTTGVILAGGTGRRLGSREPKQLAPLAGAPVIEYAIRAFEAAPEVDEILIVMTPGFLERVRDIVAAGPYAKVTGVIEGGLGRPESTCRALDALGVERPTRPTGHDVLIHDAARPFVQPGLISACVHELRTYEAVGAAVPTSDTIVALDEHTGATVADVPRRDLLRRVQTPQGFRLSTIRRAYELARHDPGFRMGDDASVTDDWGVLRRFLPEVPIAVVPGSERNMKITTSADLALARTLLEQPGPEQTGPEQTGPDHDVTPGDPARADDPIGEPR